MPPETAAAKRPRRPSVLRMLLVCLVVGFFGGAAIAVAQAVFGESAWIYGGGMAVAMVVAYALILPSWNRLDEAVKAAHQWAWFWGASAGLVVAAVVGPFVLAGHIDLSGATPGESAVNGAVALIVLQCVGYAVAWAIWWLRRR